MQKKNNKILIKYDVLQSKILDKYESQAELVRAMDEDYSAFVRKLQTQSPKFMKKLGKFIDLEGVIQNQQPNNEEDVTNNYYSTPKELLEMLRSNIEDLKADKENCRKEIDWMKDIIEEKDIIIRQLLDERKNYIERNP